MSEKRCAICGYIRSPDKFNSDKFNSELGIESDRIVENSASDWVCPICHAPEDLFFDNSKKPDFVFKL